MLTGLQTGRKSILGRMALGLDTGFIDVTRKLAPKAPQMTPEAFRKRLDEMGLTQGKIASTWGFSPDLVSRWATGKVAVPGWMRHALDGVDQDRMRKRAKDRGYQWPPAGYEPRSGDDPQ